MKVRYDGTHPVLLFQRGPDGLAPHPVLVHPGDEVDLPTRPAGRAWSTVLKSPRKGGAS